MKQTDKEDGFVELTADAGHYLHQIGSDSNLPIGQTTVPAANVGQWEELPLSERPAYTRAQYAAEVERLIAERYSHGKEIEVNREAVAKPEQFAEYLDYVAECKERAKAALQGQNDSTN